jgi:hypothetical protein
MRQQVHGQMKNRIKFFTSFFGSMLATGVILLFGAVFLSEHLVEKSQNTLLREFPNGTAKEKILQRFGTDVFQCQSSSKCTFQIHDFSGFDVSPGEYGSAIIVYFSNLTGGHSCVFLFDDNAREKRLFCGRS